MPIRMPSFLSRKKIKKDSIVNYIPQGAGIFHTPSGHVYMFANASMNSIINNYTQIAPLNSGINKISRAMANVPIALFNIETEEKVPNHSILRLLKNPNMNNQKIYTDLVRDFIIWRLLDGNSYFIITGLEKPIAIANVSPQFIRYHIGADGFVDRYDFTANQGTVTFNKNSAGKFVDNVGFQELFVISNFHPNKGANQPMGMSEIQALYYEINQYLHAGQHNLSLLQNGARPSGAFVLENQAGVPQNFSDAQFARLKQEVNESYSGSVNAGRPMFLEGGLKFVEMSINPKDMDFVKLKDQAEQKIYNALDIPISLMMDVKLTANNMSSIKLEFYQSRILPLTTYLLNYLNLFLLSRYPDSENFELRVDEDKVDVLLPIIETRRKVVEDSTVMMISEKRKTLNLPHIEGSDVVVDPNGRHIVGPDAVLTVGEIGSSNAPASPPKDPEDDNSDDNDSQEND